MKFNLLEHLIGKETKERIAKLEEMQAQLDEIKQRLQQLKERNL